MPLFRRPPPRFDLPAIGDRWDHLPLADAMTSSMAIRVLPDGFNRAPYPFVALIQPVTIVLPDQFDRWTAATHFALERDAAALLALVHVDGRQVTWYAYAATRAQLEAALQNLHSTNPVRWAINEDRDWNEVAHARSHAAAAAAALLAASKPRDDAADTSISTEPPPAPPIVRCTPIETPLGFLTGRDRLHVDAIHHDPEARTLLLTGEINGASEWIAYELHFAAVAAVAVEECDGSAWQSLSDLNDVVDSLWPAVFAAGGPARRHVIVQTYDDLFHVACEGMTLHLGARRARDDEPLPDPPTE
jgi:hypothetical protein